MNRGYIKLFRKIEDNDIFEGEPQSRYGAWVDLLLLVNHKDGSFMNGTTKYVVKRGQKWTSIGKLCERWHWGRDKVTRYLNLLESEGMIYQERTNRGLLITVVNFTFYQDFKTSTRQQTEQQTEQPIRQQTNNRPNNRPDSRPDTNNNVKNELDNEIKNDSKNEKLPAAQRDFFGEVKYEE